MNEYILKILYALSYRFTVCMCMWVCAQLCMSLCNPQSVACQAPLSRKFLRQEYWSGLPFPTPGDLWGPGIEPLSPVSPGRQDSLPLHHLGILYPLSYRFIVHIAIIRKRGRNKSKWKEPSNHDACLKLWEARRKEGILGRKNLRS